MHAKALEDNRFLRDEVRQAVEAGMPVYAECGGLMYLGKAIEQRRRVSRMAGVFPWTTRLLPKRKALGYREVSLNENCPFLKKGKIRGHEFHYSEMSGNAGLVLWPTRSRAGMRITKRALSTKMLSRATSICTSLQTRPLPPVSSRLRKNSAGESHELT